MLLALGNSAMSAITMPLCIYQANACYTSRKYLI